MFASIARNFHLWRAFKAFYFYIETHKVQLDSKKQVILDKK